jgi:hypothetical protein
MRAKVKVQGWVSPSTLEDAIEVYASSEDSSFSEFLERLLTREIAEHRDKMRRKELASQYDGEPML